ncbi:MAG: alpha/beta hydrolase [Desulfobacteraceae bacterium]|jgi:hypothetical protein
MTCINTKSVNIPIEKASSDKKFIHGRIYGAGNIAIIFSNMDTNNQDEWEPIIGDLISNDYIGLTYAYPEHLDDQSGTLKDAVSFISNIGAEKIFLVGASRGGVASIKFAAHNINNNRIVGVVAFSAPLEYEGTVFYNHDELSRIKIPKLLLNSQGDDGAADNRKMIEILSDPKELKIYSGDAHGTQLFGVEKDSIVRKIKKFIKYVLSN